MATVLPPNTVAYTVYTPPDSALDGAAWLAALNKVAAPIVRDHIWQQDAFGLRVTAAAVLAGTTTFGDNIDDEWLIVHVLLVVTTVFPELLVTVEDDDGQFILIEAADHVPAWLDPDTCANRVFLRGGDVYLVPPPLTPAHVGVLPGGEATVEAALAAIRTVPALCRASGPLQATLRVRLAGFDRHVAASKHHVTCLLPASAAALLQAAPTLVAAAVRAFHERDPVDMKHCARMAIFPPVPSVMARVTMTRCLFAQLNHHRFHPGKLFGPAPPPGSPAHKAFVLGAKLACGFEILVTRCPRPAGDSPTNVAGPHWDRFLQRLASLGYFREHIVDSKGHTLLIEQAKVVFAVSAAAGGDGDDAVLEEQLSSLQQAAVYVVECLGGLRPLPPAVVSEELPPDSADDWLDLDPGVLEKQLQERYGTPAASAGGNSTSAERHAATPDHEKLQRVVNDVSKFFADESSFEGVEMRPGSAAGSSSFVVDAVGGVEADVRHRSVVGPGVTFADSVNDGSEQGDDAPQSLDSDKDAENSDDDDPDRVTFTFDAFVEAMLGHTEESVSRKTRGSQGTGNDDDDDDDDENASGSGDDADAEDIAAAMAAELRNSGVTQGFSGKVDGTFENEDPVDLDFNLVANLFRSLQGQDGAAGPASSLLGSLFAASADGTTS